MRFPHCWSRRPEFLHLQFHPAPAVDRKHEWVRLVSETQNLWQPFDHGRKCDADLWNCGRLSCARCGAISILDHRCDCRHGRGMDSPLFLLPCRRPLGCRTKSWHSLCFLHGRRDRESRRLARWTPVVIRTSSFFWSADREGLHAKGKAGCQSDYVVCGSDVFRCCPNPRRALGMALGCPVGQVVLSGCAFLGGRNVGK